MAPQELARSKGQAVSSDREDKYLTFSLAGERYGIGTMTVEEIIGVTPLDPLAGVPGGIKGLVKASPNIS